MAAAAPASPDTPAFGTPEFRAWFADGLEANMCTWAEERVDKMRRVLSMDKMPEHMRVEGEKIIRDFTYVFVYMAREGFVKKWVDQYWDLMRRSGFIIWVMTADPIGEDGILMRLSVHGKRSVQVEHELAPNGKFIHLEEDQDSVSIQSPVTCTNLFDDLFDNLPESSNVPANKYVELEALLSCPLPTFWEQDDDLFKPLRKGRRKMPASTSDVYRQQINSDYLLISTALNNMRRRKNQLRKEGALPDEKFNLLFTQVCSRYSALYREKRRIEDFTHKAKSLYVDAATQTE